MRSKALTHLSLHKRVADTLRAEIAQNYKPGQRIEPIRQLAKRFGVSELTLRIALTNLAQEGLLTLRQGSGCYVTDSATTKPVGILTDIDLFHPHTSFFHRRLIQQIRQWCVEFGYRERLYIGHIPPGQIEPSSISPEFLLDSEEGRLRAVAALLIAGPPPVHQMEAHGVPVVGIDFFSNTRSIYKYRVALDTERLIPEAIKVAKESGRNRIALINWHLPSNNSDFTTETFHRSMAEAGLTVRPAWVQSDTHLGPSSAGWNRFRSIWNASSTEKPDALIVCDDLLFPDVHAAILDSGIRVPDQLLVITHANKGTGFFHSFPVVRLEYDPDEVAQAVGALLEELLKGKPVSKPGAVIHFKIIQSTASDPDPILKPAAGLTVHPSLQE